MLRKVIHYEDYDGNMQECEAYFNLSKMEITDLNLEYETVGGIAGYFKKLIEDRNGFVKKPSIDFVRRLVDMAYGVRPKDNPNKFLKVAEDGHRLIDDFKDTIPYDDYIYLLITDEDALTEFGKYAMPKITEEQQAEAEKLLKAEGLITDDGEISGNAEKVVSIEAAKE